MKQDYYSKTKQKKNNGGAWTLGRQPEYPLPVLIFNISALITDYHNHNHILCHYAFYKLFFSNSSNSTGFYPLTNYYCLFPRSFP